MEPTELIFRPVRRPLCAAAGPLTAALSLAREFPHLSFSELDLRNGRLSISLGDDAADHFTAWVEALDLTAREPLAFEYAARAELALYASGSWDEVPVDLRAYVPAVGALTAVAA